MWNTGWSGSVGRAVVVALLLMALSTMRLPGEPARCADTNFQVEAGTPELKETLCEIVPEIRDDLGTCGLKQHRPLTVEVVDDVSHPMGSCIAYFDCEYDLIRLTNPDLFQTVLDDTSPYARLPAEITMKAILTHELAHALATQSAGEHRLDMVDQEYIAAAMELDSMEQEWRQVLLDASLVSLPPSEGLIDIWFYGFAPRKFGVSAWNHFRQPEHGCQLIRRMVAGEVSFAKPTRPELR